MSFSFSHEKIGNLNVFNVKGYVDKEAGKSLRLKVEEKVNAGETLFLLDFSLAPLVNSTGLAEVIDLVSLKGSNSKLNFAFSGLSTVCQFSFNSVGIFHYAQAFTSRSEALLGLKKEP
ncbi:hypothetical protein HYY75_03920 [bacterium]|nr:hypothetical protein [bacterium]